MASKPRPPSDPLETAAEALDELKGSDDWDVPTSPTLNVHVHPRTPSPPPASELPTRRAVTQRPLEAPSTLRVVFATVQRVPPWGVVIVLLAAIAGYVVLALQGKAPVP